MSTTKSTTLYVVQSVMKRECVNVGWKISPKNKFFLGLIAP